MGLPDWPDYRAPVLYDVPERLSCRRGAQVDLTYAQRHLFRDHALRPAVRSLLQEHLRARNRGSRAAAGARRQHFSAFGHHAGHLAAPHRGESSRGRPIGQERERLYELGLAHALRKPVILVANSMEDVPFDLRGLRVLCYDKEIENWGAELGRTVAASLKETLADPARAIPSTFVDRRAIDAPKTDPLQTVLRQLTEEVRAVRRQTDWYASERKGGLNSEGEELEKFTRAVIQLGVFDDFPEVYDELKFRIIIWLARSQRHMARDALSRVSSRPQADQDVLLDKISDLVNRLYRS